MDDCHDVIGQQGSVFPLATVGTGDGKGNECLDERRSVVCRWTAAILAFSLEEQTLCRRDCDPTYPLAAISILLLGAAPPPPSCRAAAAAVRASAGASVHTA